MTYRDATLTPPVDTTPPWWQRLWFWLDRESACRLWQWARRRVGGRWYEGVSFFGGREPWCVAWMRSRDGDCPLTWHRFTEDEERGVAIIWAIDMRAQNRTIDHHRATVDEHGRCGCEVWP